MICGGTKPIRPMRIGCDFPGPVGQFAVEDHVGRQVQRILARAGAERAGEVRADDGEGGAGVDLVHELDAVVELVVAQRAGVVAQRVHPGDHRVQVSLGHAARIGDVVAHRVALEVVAVVDGQACSWPRPGSR
jgi:hypothetical protein